MTLIKVKGKTVIREYPVTTSTAFLEKSLVALSSGKLIPATSSTTAAANVGVLHKAITSSDADYADARKVKVEVPIEKKVIWDITVTSGLVANDIGLFQDLTNSVSVDRGSSSIDAVQCVRVLSTTKGHFILNDGGTKA